MQKIKQFMESYKGRNVLMVMIVLLVGLGAFELGRLSKQNSTDGVKIEYPSDLQQPINQTANALSATALTAKTSPATPKPVVVPYAKNFFASSRGSKYYPVGCSAGKSLKQENRVYFATREEAEKAGYELSSSCR